MCIIYLDIFCKLLLFILIYNKLLTVNSLPSSNVGLNNLKFTVSVSSILQLLDIYTVACNINSGVVSIKVKSTQAFFQVMHI